MWLVPTRFNGSFQLGAGEVNPVGLLFLIALVLAWPTYGLSIIAWFALSVVRYALKDKTAERQRAAYDLPARDYYGDDRE
jgi:hypothetical protein